MRNFLVITLSLFVFIFVFDFVVHNILLTPLYRETSEHWRDVEAFMSYAPYFFAGKALMAAAIAGLYVKFRKTGSAGEGALLGLFVGLIFSGRYMVAYATENLFTFDILLAWIGGYALPESILSGVLAALLYRARTE